MPEDILSEIAKLENKLQAMRGQQLKELQDKLTEAKRVVLDLENQIAALTGKRPASKGRRTTSDEMRERIANVLSKNPKGLTQKEISKQTGIVYGSLVAYLRNHPKEFKSSGTRKSKRFFVSKGH